VIDSPHGEPRRDLADALAKASRDTYWPPAPWWAPSSPWSSLMPPEPPKPPAHTDVASRARSAHTVTEGPTVASRVNSVHAVTEFEVVPVWQASLEVSVWRPRWWFRLAASLVVKRLNR
jgi:hypothetical protein